MNKRGIAISFLRLASSGKVRTGVRPYSIQSGPQEEIAHL